MQEQGQPQGTGGDEPSPRFTKVIYQLLVEEKALDSSRVDYGKFVEGLQKSTERGDQVYAWLQKHHGEIIDKGLSPAVWQRSISEDLAQGGLPASRTYVEDLYGALVDKGSLDSEQVSLQQFSQTLKDKPETRGRLFPALQGHALMEGLDAAGFEARLNSSLTEQEAYEAAKAGMTIGEYLGDGANRISRGFYRLPGDVLMGAGLLDSWISRQAHKLTGSTMSYLDGQAENNGLFKAGRNYVEWLERNLPTDARNEGTLGAAFASGLGQLASMVVTGGATGAVRNAASTLGQASAQGAIRQGMQQVVQGMTRPEGVIAGMQVMGQTGQEALEMGATDEEAFEAALRNGFVGSALESMPMQGFWKRLQKARPGLMQELAKMVEGGVEEGSTEILQSLYENYTAQELYDEGRELLDGAGDSGTVGFGLGFLMNAMGVRLRNLKGKPNLNSTEQTQLAELATLLQEKQGELASLEVTMMEKVEEGLEAVPQAPEPLESSPTEPQANTDASNQEPAPESTVEGVPEDSPRATEAEPTLAPKASPDPTETAPETTVEAPSAAAGDFQYATRQHHYEVRREDGALVITRDDGEAPGKTVEKEIRKVYREAYDYTDGEVAPNFEGNPEEFSQHLASTSQQPAELARQWLVAQDQQHQQVSYQEQAIGEHLGKVRREDYIQYGDSKRIGQSLARAYFSKEGEPLDIQAQRISEMSGTTVTEQDLIDYIDKHPNGPNSGHKQSEGQVQLESRFRALTGIPLTEDTALRAESQLRGQEQAAHPDFPEVDSQLLRTLEAEGVTLDTLEGLKDSLFGGFPFTPEDYEHARQALEAQSSLANEAERAGTEGPAGDTEAQRGASEVRPPKSSPPSSPTDSRKARVAADVQDQRTRRVASRILNDPDLDPRLKEGFSQERKFYTPVDPEQDAAWVNEFLEMHGVDGALDAALDPTQVEPGRLVVKILTRLYADLKAKRKGTVDAQTLQKIHKQQERVIESLTQLGTVAGQQLQAFRELVAGDPEHLEWGYRQSVEQAQAEALAEAAPTLEAVKDAVEQSHAETIDALLADPAVRDILEKRYRQQKRISEKIGERRRLVREKAEGWIDQQIRNLDEGDGALQDVTYGLTKAVYRGGLEVMRLAVRAGDTLAKAVEKTVAWIEQRAPGGWQKDAFLENFGRLAAQEKIMDQLAGGDLDPAIRGAIEQVQGKLQEVVSRSGADQQKARTALETYFREVLLLEPQQIVSLLERYGELVAAKKRQLLDQALGVHPKGTKAKRRQFHEDVIRLTNLGALQQTEYRQLYAQKMGLPHLTEAESDQLKALSERAQAAPEGYQRREAIQDMLRFQDSLGKVKFVDVAMSLWYANILSGPSTHALNVAANLMETLAEFSSRTLKGIVQHRSAKYSTGQVGAMLRGLVKGLEMGRAEASNVWKTGYQPDRGSKLEWPGGLELIEGKNPLKLWRYVTRALAASDALFYETNKRMRIHELAHAHAYHQNKKSPSEGNYSKAYALATNSKARYAEAMQQAKDEGKTGRNLKRRMFEIMDSTLPDWMRDDAKDTGQRATFNYDPEGYLGLVSNGISAITSDVKLGKFLIPFTRTITNVVNRYLDYSAIGLYRAARGRIVVDIKDKKAIHRNMSKEERTHTLVKGLMGMVSMVALYGLSDDEEGILEVTGSGTGNWSKNLEMQEANWQPYSIRIRGTDAWWSYKETPLFMALGPIGTLRDGVRFEDEKTANQQAVSLLQSFGHQLMDIYVLKQLADFLTLMGDTEDSSKTEWNVRRMNKTLANTMKSFVLPNAVSQVSRVVQEVQDEPMKMAPNPWTSVYRDLPLVRDGLSVMYNGLGEPVVNESLYKWNPIARIKVEDEQASRRLWQLIVENDAWVGRPDRNKPVPDFDGYGERRLLDHEYSEWVRVSGLLLRDYLTEQFDYIRDLETQQERKEYIGKLKQAARKEGLMQVLGY